MDNSNWSNTNYNAHNASSGVPGQPGPGPGGWDPGQGPSQTNERRVVISPEGMQSAVLKKSKLTSHTIRYFDAAKQAIISRSEEEMMEHQRKIEKLKFELATLEQKATQVRLFWNTQRVRVEGAITEAAQALQQLVKLSQAYGSPILRHLLVPDYSWMDQIIQNISGVSSSATLEQWKALRTHFQRWNWTIGELARRGVYDSVAPAQNSTITSPLLYTSLQGSTSNNSAVAPPVYYTQTPLSAELSNNPQAVPNVTLMPATANTNTYSNCSFQSSALTPSTSTYHYQPPSSNSNPNFVMSNPNPYIRAQDQLIRELLGQPNSSNAANNANTNTVVEVSRTQVLINAGSSIQLQVTNGCNNRQYDTSENVQRAANAQQAQLRLQQQRLHELKQLELQQQQLQNEIDLRLRSPVSCAPVSSASQPRNTTLASGPQQSTSAMPGPSSGHGSTTQVQVNEVAYANSCEAGHLSDDGCEILEDQDPFADIVFDSERNNGSEFRAPLSSQNEILTLAKAQRRKTECCSGIFEEETTEVIHLNTVSPTLAIESAITPPYSDLSDQEQPRRPPGNASETNLHLAASSKSAVHMPQAQPHKSKFNFVQGQPQKIIKKRNSTGSMDTFNAKKPKGTPNCDPVDGLYTTGRSPSTDKHVQLNKNLPNCSDVRVRPTATQRQVWRPEGLAPQPKSAQQAHSKPTSQQVLSKRTSSEQLARCVNNINTFADLKLDVRLVRWLKECGLDLLTSVQKGSFPEFLSNKELILVGEAGSGKTTMYLVGLLHKLSSSFANGKTAALQAIIVTSSMACALSIKERFNQLAAFTPQSASSGTLKAVCTNDAVFDNGHVLIGTPASMKTFFALQQQQSDRLSKTKNIKCVIVDNAEYIQEEFFPMIIGIIYNCQSNGNVQVVILSRTLEKAGFSHLKNALREPKVIISHNQTLTIGSKKQVLKSGNTFCAPSPPVVSTPQPEESIPGSAQDSRSTASPPVISIPESKAGEAPTEQIHFFVTGSTSEETEISDLTQESTQVVDATNPAPTITEPVAQENHPAEDQLQDKTNSTNMPQPTARPVASVESSSTADLSIARPEPTPPPAPLPPAEDPTTDNATSESPLNPTPTEAFSESPNQVQNPTLPPKFHHFLHFYCDTNDLYDRVETVKALANTIMIGQGQAYIFCKQTKCDWLNSELADSENLLCQALDGTKSEPDLLSILEAFRSGELKALILNDEISEKYATKLKQVPFVFNFDYPDDDFTYLRRSSFAAFNDDEENTDPDNATNVVVMSLTAGEKDLQLLHEIERKYNISINDASSNDDES